jgi:8-oxo-dGTP pyrophosphatase MutT (NUDIX family)
MLLYQRRRAYIYVTREKGGARQLLVFTQDSPDSGIQVPGGSIESHETPMEGMRREILEEAGLNDFLFERALAVDVQQVEKEGYGIPLFLAEQPNQRAACVGW